MKLNSKIGEKIEQSGLRDDFIAAKLGISKKQVYNLKKGLSFPTFKNGFILADLLKCKVDELAELEKRDD